jgi:CRISPR-associated endonuclease/helicase Cas3
MLDGTAEDRVLDVADAEADTPDAAGARGLGRLRVLIKRGDETAEWFARRLDTGKALDLGDAAEATAKLSRVARMGRGSLAEKRRIILAEDEETGQPTKVLLLLADPGSGETAEENSAASAGPQTLSDHLSEVRAEARRLVARIGELVPHGAKRLAEAVILAAEWHDRGKDREAWQADIGHARPRGAAGFWEPWAKSGRRGFVSRLSGEYRHELGSLREATADPLISEHPERELILHLIAAHHGWARPHFEGGHWDIAEGVDDA